MSNFQISVNAVLPVFLLMAAGYLSKRAGIIKEENVGSFNALPLFRAGSAPSGRQSGKSRRTRNVSGGFEHIIS